MNPGIPATPEMICIFNFWRKNEEDDEDDQPLVCREISNYKKPGCLIALEACYFFFKCTVRAYGFSLHCKSKGRISDHLF